MMTAEEVEEPADGEALEAEGRVTVITLGLKLMNQQKLLKE